MPAGYLIARDQVGTAQSASNASGFPSSTDGLSVEELKELKLSDDEIDHVISWRKYRAEMQQLEEEHAPSLNVIAKDMPSSTVEWCREQTAASAESDVTDVQGRCEAIKLAAEGKLAGGIYTDAELATAVRRARLSSSHP